MTAKTRSGFALETEIPDFPKSFGSPNFIFVHVFPASMDLNNPEFSPPDSITQGYLWCCHIEAYKIRGFVMSIDKEEAPVVLFTERIFFQVFPPSVVLYMPLSLEGAY